MTDDIFETQRQIGIEQEKKRRDIAVANRVNAELFGEDIKSAVDRSNEARKRFYDLKKQRDLRDSNVDIRTVSDSSPDDSWIVPARDLDMTRYLTEINMQLAESIDITIQNVVGF